MIQKSIIILIIIMIAISTEPEGKNNCAARKASL